MFYTKYTSMNWYKECSPVVESVPRGMTYMDVGHKTPGSELWVIDKDYNFFSTKFDIDPDEEYGYGHHNWREFRERSATRLAHGRYDPVKNIVSVFYLTSPYGIPDSRKYEYVIKRIFKILDKNYNNPTIVNFQ